MKRHAGRYIITGILIGLFLKLFVLDILHISGNSMEPAIHDGAAVLVNKLAYGIDKPFGSSRLCGWASPKAGDVVIYLYHNKIIIKRIAAVEGTPLDYSSDKGYTLHVNNTSYPLTQEQYNAMSPINLVPEGTVLAIGDNHAVSIDSRNYGFVPVYNVLGKAVCK